MKKFALIASAATALVCTASLLATPVDAKHRHKKPEAAAQTMGYGPGPMAYNAGPRHDLGGPMKVGGQCWKDRDPWANIGQGYWGKC